MVQPLTSFKSPVRLRLAVDQVETETGGGPSLRLELGVDGDLIYGLFIGMCWTVLLQAVSVSELTDNSSYLTQKNLSAVYQTIAKCALCYTAITELAIVSLYDHEYIQHYMRKGATWRGYT